MITPQDSYYRVEFLDSRDGNGSFRSKSADEILSFLECLDRNTLVTIVKYTPLTYAAIKALAEAGE